MERSRHPRPAIYTLDGTDLIDLGEVAKVLIAAGLDPATIGNRIQDQDVGDRLKAKRTQQWHAACSERPTSFVGDMMFFGNDRRPPSKWPSRETYMTKLGQLLAIATLLAAAPSYGQTVGSCARSGGANQPQPVWLLFELGSAHVRAGDKQKIAEAVKTAKDRQVTAICLVGHTDKLGDKALNAKLARERSQAVAAELIHAGYPANDIVIAEDPEAFGDMSLGSSDASAKDRRVTILFSR